MAITTVLPFALLFTFINYKHKTSLNKINAKQQAIALGGQIYIKVIPEYFIQLQSN